MKVRPGQRWRPPRAADVNAADDAVQMYRRGQPTAAALIRGGPFKVKNTAATQLDAGSVVKVGTFLLTDKDDTGFWFNGDAITSGANQIAILQQPLLASAIGDAVLSGLCIALVNVGATWHRRAYPIAAETVLTSGLFGPVEILNNLTATGEQLCMCLIGNQDSREVFAVVSDSGGLTAATFTGGTLTLGSGTVTILDPDGSQEYSEASSKTLTAYNPAGEVADDTQLVLVPSDDWMPIAVIEPTEINDIGFFAGVNPSPDPDIPDDGSYLDIPCPDATAGYVLAGGAGWTTDSYGDRFVCEVAGLWEYTIRFQYYVRDSQYLSFNLRKITGVTESTYDAWTHVAIQSASSTYGDIATLHGWAEFEEDDEVYLRVSDFTVGTVSDNAALLYCAFAFKRLGA